MRRAVYVIMEEDSFYDATEPAVCVMVISPWNIGEEICLLDKNMDKCIRPQSIFRLGLGLNGAACQTGLQICINHIYITPGSTSFWTGSHYGTKDCYGIAK